MPSNSSPASATKKFVLQGQVSHAESMPALDPSLQAGSSFKSGSMPEAKYASNWFKIPSWFAGTFESSHSTTDYMKDYATGRTSRPNKTVASSGREVHGFQKDTQGNVWHFYVQSGSSKSDQGRQMTINNIDFYGPEYVTNDRVIMKVLATSLIVDKVTGVIVDSFRREDIKTYEPLRNGQLSVHYTSKSFDSHGRPRDLQNGHSIHQLVSQFEPIDHDGKNDYKQMLRDFLVHESSKQH